MMGYTSRLGQHGARDLPFRGIFREDIHALRIRNPVTSAKQSQYPERLCVSWQCVGVMLLLP